MKNQSDTPQAETLSRTQLVDAIISKMKLICVVIHGVFKQDINTFVILFHELDAADRDTNI